MSLVQVISHESSTTLQGVQIFRLDGYVVRSDAIISSLSHYGHVLRVDGPTIPFQKYSKVKGQRAQIHVPIDSVLIFPFPFFKHIRRGVSFLGKSRNGFDVFIGK